MIYGNNQKIDTMKFKRDYSVEELLSFIDYDINNCNITTKSIVSGFADDFFVADNFLTWTESKLMLNSLLSNDLNLTIITNQRVDKVYSNKNIIRSGNPLRIFELIIDSVFSYPSIEPQIAENTNIHKTVIIGNNVRIGSNCKIAPYVVIGDNVTIGNNVEISSFSVIGNEPYGVLWDKNQRLRKRKIFGCVRIHDNVQIGSFCSIDNGFTNETVIGRGSRIGNLVEIGHDVYIGNECCFSAQVGIAGYVKIGNSCVFWGKSGVVNRITIASGTTILASSILTKDVLTSGRVLCGFPAIDRFKYWKTVAMKGSKF